MIFRSIRSRLALNFAGIALIAATVLGVVLLVILQKYYLDLEVQYLRGNAEAISGFLIKMMSANASPDEIQSQIKNLALLSQTRIQVYSLKKQLLYDSGSPTNIKVDLRAIKQTLAETNSVLPTDLVIIALDSKGNSQLISPDIYPYVQAAGSPFGFDQKGKLPFKASRSRMSVTMAMRDPNNAADFGLVKLSEGPAYGNAILMSVAQGWVLSSAIAVLIAAAVGWYISRRFSAPVLALTDVTTHMAHGDLSSRASEKSRDEFGQLARSFNEMANQVETTVTTLRRFVSDAAHELRTPLTVLRTNLDLALDENNPANRTAFLTDAQAMVKRLDELNTNLLDLSRLEAKGQESRRVVVDLTELVRSRQELYTSQAEQAGLSFEFNFPSGPTEILADESQLTRAIDNLMDNACKFTPQGGTVHMALSQQDKWVVFSVRDTGIGIPPDELPQLFNRFHRGRNVTSYPGSGLGLAIVRAILAAHNGQVEAQSPGEGQGSQFSICLPVASRQGP